jgi:hypothetical protein
MKAQSMRFAPDGNSKIHPVCATETCHIFRKLTVIAGGIPFPWLFIDELA